MEPVVEEDPCNPNPCGPYSNPPRQNGDRCDCSCLPGMVGSPPNCKPECILNQDCPTDKACRRQKCVDPCPGICGQNAYCNVRNHVPICICNKGYVGNPFASCQRPTSKNSELYFIGKKKMYKNLFHIFQAGLEYFVYFEKHLNRDIYTFQF